ncbi:MAG TPA: NifU family protein [Gemmatimonadaceae bacterium]|nr:NifU family protein [Gemmatimonadaceae bacterium]
MRRGSGRSFTVVESSISEVLLEVTPLLRMEHCRLEIAEFVPESGLLCVKIEGSCPDCLGSPAMFATAIKARVKQRVPEVRDVRIADGDSRGA